MGYRNLPLTERFAAKVERVPEAGCWLWVAFIDGRGYGRIFVDGEACAAHRVAWELFRGPIPGGLEIDHLCRVRSCVNPDHLEPVTRKENVRRGSGWAGRNARKTHCPKGHALASTKWWGGRRRICPTCLGVTGVPFNGDKTHCKHGHEFTPENTHRTPGRRRCRVCDRDRDKTPERRAVDRAYRARTVERRQTPEFRARAVAHTRAYLKRKAAIQQEVSLVAS